MTLTFGTDGVRGVANAELTPELVLALGRAAALVLGGDRFVVGRDTRRSGPLVQAALSAGLLSQGVSVVDVGVVPTPVVAHASSVGSVPGAMISASHNVFGDNGIKFFAPGGHKLTDAQESQLETELARASTAEDQGSRRAVPTGADVGTGRRDDGGVLDRYRQHLHDGIEGRRLSGLSVVLDCANGAASTVAPEVVRGLGAEVGVLGDRPDGTNINDGCGSTSPAALQRAVLHHGADAGLAFDGDADRLIAADAQGQLVDGDQIIGLCAVDRHRRQRLAHDTVVVTVMTNMGFRLAMAEHGIHVVETDVGDRHVLAAMHDGGFSLGGEQSGHVIFGDVATTGDGLLTAITVLDVMARTGRTLSELASVMRRLPQVLLNVPTAGRGDVIGELADHVVAAETELAGEGRVLVRASGTEPMVRIMVEAPSTERAEAIASRLAGAVAPTAR